YLGRGRITGMNSAPPPQMARVEQLAAVLEEGGWSVDVEPVGPQRYRSDLVAGRGTHRYAVELTAEPEGRPDRALAPLSQAILQASRYAADLGMRPLAVVGVGSASPSLRRRLVDFQRDYAPDVAVGLVSEAGGSLFIGPGLDGLDREEPKARRSGRVAQ